MGIMVTIFIGILLGIIFAYYLYKSASPKWRDDGFAWPKTPEEHQRRKETNIKRDPHAKFYYKYKDYIIGALLLFIIIGPGRFLPKNRITDVVTGILLTSILTAFALFMLSTIFYFDPKIRKEFKNSP